jgi:hypothetical protein
VLVVCDGAAGEDGVVAPVPPALAPPPEPLELVVGVLGGALLWPEAAPEPELDGVVEPEPEAVVVSVVDVVEVVEAPVVDEPADVAVPMTEVAGAIRSGSVSGTTSAVSLLEPHAASPPAKARRRARAVTGRRMDAALSSPGATDPCDGRRWGSR